MLSLFYLGMLAVYSYFKKLKKKTLVVISNIHLQLQHMLSSHVISSMHVPMCVLYSPDKHVYILLQNNHDLYALHLICKVMIIPILVMFVVVVRTHTRVTFKVFLCTFSQKSHEYGFQRQRGERERTRMQNSKVPNSHIRQEKEFVVHTRI